MIRLRKKPKHETTHESSTTASHATPPHGSSTQLPVWSQASSAHSHSPDDLTLQAKLTINQPSDAYEQEADRVADSVMRMPAPGVQRKCACGGDAGSDGECPACRARRLELQRQPLEEEEEMMQPKRSEGGGHTQSSAPPIVHKVIQSPGRPLDGGTRAMMESRFGHDFGQVRVHNDTHAHQSAKAVNAQAYTVGNNIVFGAGRFNPAAYSGQHLLAHELTHVIQQSGDGMQRQLQRDLAIEPVVANPVDRGMSQQDIERAIRFNENEFDDPYSLAVIRDVIGVSRFPAVSDSDLALGVARWQSRHGIAQDGMLGAVTVTYVIEELQAEGNNADAALLMAEFPSGTFLDVDTSFCGCRTELNDQITESNFFIAEYQACGADPTNTTGDQIEACITARAAARGQTLTTAGTTSSSGQINVATTPGPCGPLIDRITLAHEQIHSVHTRELRQQHGSGAAFNAAFNDATDWVADEVNSRNTDIAVAQWAIGILDRICP